MRAHLFAMFQSIQSEIERVATLGQPGIGGKSLPRAEPLTFGEVAEDVEAERMQEKLEGYHGGRVNVVALKRQLDEVCSRFGEIISCALMCMHLLERPKICHTPVETGQIDEQSAIGRWRGRREATAAEQKDVPNHRKH